MRLHIIIQLAKSQLLTSQEFSFVFNIYLLIEYLGLTIQLKNKMNINSHSLPIENSIQNLS